MTAEEVYKSVLKELKQEYTTSITPEEFNHHIWVAEIEYVKTRYWAHEQHQKTIDDLRTIKVMTDGIGGMPNPLIASGSALPNSQFVTLPEDYMHLTAVSAIVEYVNEPCKKNGTLSDPIACSFLPDDKEKLVLGDFYSKPKPAFPRLYYSQRGNVLVFKAGSSIVRKVFLNYLRYPKRIAIDVNTGASIQDSEFLDEQTIEIVKWCVHSYLEKIEEMRVQTMALIQSKNFEQFPSVNQL